MTNKTCITSSEKECETCELQGVLICDFSRKEILSFVIGNTSYRVVSIVIFFITGLLIGQPWMMFAYGSLVALTFLFIEPRLLCSHCPFYMKEGKYLKCGGLWGMPKLWKYHPTPINQIERVTILIIGTLIDLGPLIGVILGLIAFFIQPQENLFLGISLVLTSLVFFGLMYYFSKVLLGNRCKRCPNFSCAMNKVSQETINIFLQKNPSMQKAWKNSDYLLEKKKK